MNVAAFAFRPHFLYRPPQSSRIFHREREPFISPKEIETSTVSSLHYVTSQGLWIATLSPRIYVYEKTPTQWFGFRALESLTQRTTARTHIRRPSKSNIAAASRTTTEEQREEAEQFLNDLNLNFNKNPSYRSVLFGVAAKIRLTCSFTTPPYIQALALPQSPARRPVYWFSATNLRLLLTPARNTISSSPFRFGNTLFSGGQLSPE